MKKLAILVLESLKLACSVFNLLFIAAILGGLIIPVLTLLIKALVKYVILFWNLL